MQPQPKNIFDVFSLFKTPSGISFLLLIVVLHVAFFIYAINTNHIYLAVDSTEYLNQAKNIFEHGSWYAGDWSKTHEAFLETRRPPLYALFLSFLRFFSASDFFVLIIQNMLSIFSICMCVCIIQMLIEEKVNLFFVFALLLFFPTQVIYANMIMADVLFQFLLVMSIYFFTGFVKKKSPMQFLLCNVFLSFAILTKPVLYWFWIFVFLLALLLWSKNQLRVLHVSYSLLPLMVVLIISFFNYKNTGYFHYSSVNQKFISEYGAYLAVGQRGDSTAQRTIDSVLTIAHSKPTFKEYAEFLNTQSTELIKNNLSGFLWMQAKGMIQFFIDHGRWDLFAFFVKPDFYQEKGTSYYFEHNGLKGVVEYILSFNLFLTLYLLLITATNCFLLFCFFRFIVNQKINIPVRLFIFCLVTYLVLFTSVVGCSRYRMAVYPILLISSIAFYKTEGTNKESAS